MAEPRLKAPFPWFGGKSRAVKLIHRHLGETPNYIEPFAGSLAYLLHKRPSRYEAVNDLDVYVSNFWRAVRAEPEAVAFHADWPVNEACLTARHRYLMASWRKHRFKRRMLCDPTFYDPMVAGWWVWGISCWIGAGWCDERSEWNPRGQSRGRAMHDEPKRINIARPYGTTQMHQPSPTPEMMAQSERGVAGVGSAECGVRNVEAAMPKCTRSQIGPHKPPDLYAAQAGVRPDLASEAKGVHQPHRKRPCLGDRHGSKGCVPMSQPPPEQRPHLHNDQGASLVGRPHLQRPYEVHKPPRDVPQQIVRVSRQGDGVNDKLNQALLDWMGRLAERLRYVRVCCGDWSRIMGKAVLTAAKPTAILLDPPYSADAERHESIYAVDDTQVAHRVREWCLEHGGDESLRIALCGYAGEGHDILVEEHGWTVESWTASGGYGRIHGDEQGRSLVNRHRERVYFSPGCLRGWEATPLFAGVEEQA